MRVRLDVRPLQRSPHPLHAPAGERSRIGRAVHLIGADLGGERDELPLGRATADHEVALEALAQVLERLDQELRTRARCVTAVEQPVVETEDRHDAVVGVESGTQRGMVMDAQVTGEP